MVRASILFDALPGGRRSDDREDRPGRHPRGLHRHVEGPRRDGRPDGSRGREEIHARVAAAAADREETARTVPVREEMAAAQAVYRDAQQIAHTFMEDARLGRQIEVEKVGRVSWGGWSTRSFGTRTPC